MRRGREGGGEGRGGGESKTIKNGEEKEEEEGKL